MTAISDTAARVGTHEFTTGALPDGIVVGGPWPHTTVAWPGGKGRNATKPEYYLFQALETERARANALETELNTASNHPSEEVNRRYIVPLQVAYASAMAERDRLLIALREVEQSFVNCAGVAFVQPDVMKRARAAIAATKPSP